MPELPEVETVKQTLRQLALNKKIRDIDVFWEKIIKFPQMIEDFKLLLVGQTLQDIRRKGKFLLFDFNEYVMVSHLRMEGRYGMFEREEPVSKHTHVIFYFEDGTELRYSDVRKFGTMHVFKKGEELINKPLSLLGPDPFESTFDFDEFYSRISKSTRSIKNILLDQSVIAGLGNIYVDETLFKAGIRPERKGNSITRTEAERIRLHAAETLALAIKQGGTTIRSYVNSLGEIGMFQQELFVYGQEEKPCKSCGQPISKIKLGGRGTHFCPRCQD